MTLKVTNITKFFVVYALFEGEKHGYEIMKQIEKATGEKPSASQIYPFLQKLKDNDLVEVEKRGGRGKKVYKLTGSGEEFVQGKLKMFSNIISATVEKDLTTCAHCGCKVYEGAYTEEINGEELAFCCEHCAASYKETHE